MLKKNLLQLFFVLDPSKLISCHNEWQNCQKINIQSFQKWYQFSSQPLFATKNCIYLFLIFSTWNDVSNSMVEVWKSKLMQTFQVLLDPRLPYMLYFEKSLELNHLAMLILLSHQINFERFSTKSNLVIFSVSFMWKN